jgi:hypothetical protein
MRRTRGWQVSGLTAALLLGSLRAAAEPSGEDQALATVLFREGRALVASGKTAEACVKFEESQRLDPSGGTILNLALCHEMLGLLARSWSEFNEASARARNEGRRDRLEEASEHARALEPRLSRLTIVVPEVARVEGLRVERDGRELGRGAWSTAMPVDGGEHEVRATAPGREPFRMRAVVAREGGAVTVTIPGLPTHLAVAVASVAPVAPPAAPPPALSPLVVVTVGRPRRPDVGRTLGWLAAGVGVAQLGVAGAFGIQAFELHGKSENIDGARAADRSTLLSITGLATTALGVVLLVLAHRS